jgi:diacylglycerol kinase (ATP)
MLEATTEKILFIINPISGGKAKNDWETAIRSFYGSSDLCIEFYFLDGQTDAESIKHWIEKINPSKVVAVGGDGTVSLVAKQLLGTGIGLGILPAGSANGMAKELGLPETVNEALVVITNGNVKNADVIRVNDQVCLHLSDIGLNAQLIKHFEEGKLRGKFGYATKVIKTLWTKSMMEVKISIRDKDVVLQALMVVLANATKYGTGAVINPEGNLYDGIFEVVIMKKLALSELLKMWFRPQPFNPSKITLYPATSVSINTKKNVHFQVDGEYLGRVKKVNAEILAGQLKLIVP